LILVDETHAVMTRDAFEALPEYSCTIPTGTTIGKRWRRGEPYVGTRLHWYLGEYVPCDLPGQTGITWREILLV
jgi:hypothetical protein